MVFDGILFSIIVGLLRKGNFSGFADLKIACGWVFPTILFIQIGVFLFQAKMEWLSAVSAFIFMGVYIVGLIFLWLNRKLGFGIQLIFLGVVLNFIVMIANDGRMPVSLEAAKVLDPAYSEALEVGNYGKHAALTESSTLGFLGDVIPISDPYPKDQVISIGDIIMNIGIFIFMQKLMVKRKHSAVPA